METDHYRICAGCDGPLGQGDPFCVDCGTLSPSLLHFGALAIEVQDVPGKRLRTKIVGVLKAWFPTIDTVRADEQFRSGWHILVRGVDEDSGRRLLDALKKINLDGHLVREHLGTSWKERLVNPGLIVGAACVLLSVILGGAAAMALVPIALAAPVAWAFLASRGQRALVSLEQPSPQYERWLRLSQEYADAIGQLSSQDRETVRTLTRTVFDLQRRLSADSLVAVAAGEDKGDLHSRLTEAIRTALSLGRGISDVKDEEEGSLLKRELESLSETVSKTAAWFRSLEERPVKEPDVLTGELHEITGRIDRILNQVRTPGKGEPPRRKPIRA